MPVTVWRDLIRLHYPNAGWVRLSHDTVTALAAYKSARGMLDFEDAVTTLLGGTLAHRGGAVTGDWDRARAIADAVLYEGYLLYPYRATSSKNQSRWQFGVVGPARRGRCRHRRGRQLAAQFLVDGAQAITLVVRFLQLQHRRAERDIGGGRFEPVDELTQRPVRGSPGTRRSSANCPSAPSLSPIRPVVDACGDRGREHRHRTRSTAVG